MCCKLHASHLRLAAKQPSHRAKGAANLLQAALQRFTSLRDSCEALSEHGAPLHSNAGDTSHDATLQDDQNLLIEGLRAKFLEVAEWITEDAELANTCVLSLLQVVTKLQSYLERCVVGQCDWRDAGGVPKLL
jgi:hypothetical protein